MMVNRKRELLRRMKIVYMSEGLDTISDLPPPNKRSKLITSKGPRKSRTNSPILIDSDASSRTSKKSKISKNRKTCTPSPSPVKKRLSCSPSSSKSSGSSSTDSSSSFKSSIGSSSTDRLSSSKSAFTSSPNCSSSSKSTLSKSERCSNSSKSSNKCWSSKSDDISEALQQSSSSNSISDLEGNSKRGRGSTQKTEPKPKFEALIRKLPLHERRLMHARNGIPFSIAKNPEGVPVDYSSTGHYCAKKLSEFSDVNSGEKRIMNMWNDYIIGVMGRSFIHLPKLIELFIRDKGREIVESHLFRNAVLMIDSFHESGVLDSVDCFTAKSQLQVEVAEHMKSNDLLVTRQTVRQEIIHGVATSTFYGSKLEASSSFISSQRRSLDDHLPCRRNLSPDLLSNSQQHLSLDLRTASVNSQQRLSSDLRTSSVDTRLDDDRTRISRKGRSRLNSKGGGGSPGRGSPVRGATSSANTSIDSLLDSPSSEASLNFRRATSKKCSNVRKELWQNEGINSGVEGNSSEVMKLLDSSMFCRHTTLNPDAKTDKGNFEFDCNGPERAQESPEAIKNFLQAFDQKGLEDLENDLPVLVVMPKQSTNEEPNESKETPASQDQSFVVLSDIASDDPLMSTVTSKKRCSRSKTN